MLGLSVARYDLVLHRADGSPAPTERIELPALPPVGTAIERPGASERYFVTRAVPASVEDTGDIRVEGTIYADLVGQLRAPRPQPAPGQMAPATRDPVVQSHAARSTGVQVLVVSLLFLLALLAGSAAWAAPAPTVVHLVSITTSGRSNDTPPKGASKGDRFTTTSRLLNLRAQFGKAKGAVVGSDRGTVALTGARAGTVRGITKLPGGTISFRGTLATSGRGNTIPVVGGTGLFAGARGTLTITSSASGVVVNVYTLRYPALA